MITVMLDFFRVSMSVSLKHNRIAGMVQLDQVIAKSFAVPLLRKWSFLKCSESFECCFSLAVKLSYSCETIQYNKQKPDITNENTGKRTCQYDQPG